MQTHETKIPNKRKEPVTQAFTSHKSPFGIADTRPEAVAQRKLMEMQSLNEGNDHSLQRKENKTGLPDNLKSGIENLSGFSMDDVKVHYNSAKPAQLNAHAYAQGSTIHLAAGQEKHLPHEAWHVVQQKQGRVKPTMQMKGVSINDNPGLEKEADTMGAKALQRKPQEHGKKCSCPNCSVQLKQQTQLSKPVQKKEVFQNVSNATLQFAKCKYCGYEGTHAPGCTPESRQQTKSAKEEESKKQHDKSMDNRTREDQSHPQHGGDAKGRAKMYEKWKKK